MKKIILSVVILFSVTVLNLHAVEPTGQIIVTYGHFTDPEGVAYMQRFMPLMLSELYGFYGRPFSTIRVELQHYKISERPPWQTVERVGNQIIIVDQLGQFHDNTYYWKHIGSGIIYGVLELIDADVEVESSWIQGGLRMAKTYLLEERILQKYYRRFDNDEPYRRTRGYYQPFQTAQVDKAGGINLNGQKIWPATQPINISDEWFVAEKAILKIAASVVKGDLANSDLFFHQINEKLYTEFSKGKKKFSVREMLDLLAPPSTVIDGLPRDEWLKGQYVTFDQGADGLFFSVWCANPELFSLRLLERRQGMGKLLEKKNLSELPNMLSEISDLKGKPVKRKDTLFFGTWGYQFDELSSLFGTYRAKFSFLYTDESGKVTSFVATTIFPYNPDRKKFSFTTADQGVLVVLVDPKLELTNADTNGKIVGKWGTAYHIIPPPAGTPLKVLGVDYWIPWPYSDLIYIWQKRFDIPLSEIGSSGFQGIAFTNPTPRIITAQLDYLGDDGTTIARQEIRVHPGSYALADAANIGQVAKLTGEIFPGVPPSSSSISVVADPELQIFTLKLRNGFKSLDGFNALSFPAKRHILPKVSADTEFAISNPFPQPTTAVVMLKDKKGTVLVQRGLTIPSNGQFRLRPLEFFGRIDPEGYVQIESTTGTYSLEEVVLPGQTDHLTIAGQDMDNAVTTDNGVFPLLAVGLGWNTILDFINVGDKPSSFRVTLRDLAADVTYKRWVFDVSLAPGEKVSLDAKEVFGLSGGVANGYVLLENAKDLSLVATATYLHPAGAATTVPLQARPEAEYTLGHVAQSSPLITGLAMANHNDKPARAAIQVFGERGRLVGETVLTLKPFSRLTKLLWELVPESAGQGGGYVRIVFDQRAFLTSLFGTADVAAFSAMPGVSQ